MIKDGNGNCVNRPSTQSPRPIPHVPDADVPPIDEEKPEDTPETIKNLTIKTSYQNATISWLTQNPITDLKVTYLDQDNKEHDLKVDRQEDGQYTARVTDLIPYTKYRYKITGKLGDKDVNYTGSFTTLGLPVKLVFTRSGKPVAKAKFSIEGIELETDNQGEIILELGVSTYVLAVQDGNETVEHSITVSDDVLKDHKDPNKSVDEQRFEITLSESQASSLGWLWFLLGGLLVLLTLGIFLFIWYRRRKQDENVYPVVEAPMADSPFPTEPSQQDAPVMSEAGVINPEAVPGMPGQGEQPVEPLTTEQPMPPSEGFDQAQSQDPDYYPPAEGQPMEELGPAPIPESEPAPQPEAEGELIIREQPQVEAVEAMPITPLELDNQISDPSVDQVAEQITEAPQPFESQQPDIEQPAEPVPDQTYVDLPYPPQDQLAQEPPVGDGSLNPWNQPQVDANAPTAEPVADPNQAEAVNYVPPEPTPLPDQSTHLVDNQVDQATSRYNSVYIDEDMPEDMFETAKRSTQPQQPPQDTPPAPQ